MFDNNLCFNRCQCEDVIRAHILADAIFKLNPGHFTSYAYIIRIMPKRLNIKIMSLLTHFLHIMIIVKVAFCKILKILIVKKIFR